MRNKVAIKQLVTGVPGLDAILGGGLPELSFNLVVGAPGSGKTTLAHQIMFALATPERPALFFTVLGEPPLKMLRYQQQYGFFLPEKVNATIRYVDLGGEIASGDLNVLLARIQREVQAFSASLVFVDSFRSVMLEVDRHPQMRNSLQQFVQQLAVRMSTWQITAFLIGEYVANAETHPAFSVADGVLSLSQEIYRNSMVRKFQVMKMRGQPTSPGVHTFRITDDGIEIFPSVPILDDGVVMPGQQTAPRSAARVGMGVPLLDDMLGGGLPAGYSLLVAGPSGSGKTILATAFLQEGMRRGETGVLVAFEQTPSRSRTRTIDDMVRAGGLGLINTHVLDLSIDEIVLRMVGLVGKMKATRVVIDSLSGFELAVAPTFRQDFRESLFRMVTVLSELGVTVLMTTEMEDRYTDLRFSPYGTAFLTDAIIVQRYVEVQSHLQRVMAVVKVRGSAHSNEIRQYEICRGDIAIGQPVGDYEGLLGGSPTHVRKSATRRTVPAP